MESMNMKKYIAALLVILCLFSLAACGSDNQSADEPKTITPGRLTVAMSPDYAPMEFIEVTKEGQDKYVGFDVSLAKFIAEQMGLELLIRPMSFEACQNAVSDGTVDMAISGISWSQQREENYNLSNFYQAGDNEDAQVLITLAENAGKYDTAEKLVGVKIGAQRASVQRDITVSQLPDSQLVLFTDLDDAIQKLKDGEFDCITVAEGYAEAIIASHPEIITSGFRFVVDEKQTDYVVLLPKGSEELTETVNNILSKARMYYDTWYADARATAGIEASYDDEGNAID